MATVTLRPNANGTYQQWVTYGSGSTHYDRVSDQNDATGLESGTLHDVDTEHLENSADLGTINRITLYMRARSYNGAGAVEEVKMYMKQGDCEWDTGAFVVSRTSFTTYSVTYSRNPCTELPWTWSDINNLQQGVWLYSIDAGEYVRVADLWIVVDYTPAVVAAQPSGDGLVWILSLYTQPLKRVLTKLRRLFAWLNCTRFGG